MAEEYEPGTWILCRGEAEPYPAKILSVHSDDYVVRVEGANMMVPKEMVIREADPPPDEE